MASLVTLSSLKALYGVPDSVAFEVPEAHPGTIGPKGYTMKVELFPAMFSNRLRLPFYQLVRDFVLPLHNSTPMFGEFLYVVALFGARCWGLPGAQLPRVPPHPFIAEA